ncbi:MAG: hypothetical protein IT434_07000 [Phycisphaerales bacterium]|nr:hypothetical protein [Phycisphaerales bacterium]
MRLFVSAGAAVIVAAPCLAANTFYTDRSLFNVDARIGSLSEITFDSPDLLGQDLFGETLFGATLTSPNKLLVINAATGVRFPMSASSGEQILSPGGHDTSIENDDLMITFDTARQSAGLDVVFDVSDGLSYVSVTFYDVTGHAIASSGVIPAPTGAPGYQFVGLVSDGPAIAAIVIDESDGTPNDDHIGYDTITFSKIPAPGTLALLGLAGLVSRRRR